MKVENRELAPGVHCIMLPDSRFKTARITVALLLPLAKETVEEYALLPRLLIRNCASCPDFTTLNKRLNDLYGAAVSGEVTRIGEMQAVLLTAENTDDRFALHGESVTAACAELLTDMLFRPLLENGCFREEDVATERRCLAEEVRAQINEKQWYARTQAEKLLCPEEAYGIGAFGSPDIIAALTPERMTIAWKRMLRQASVQLILQDAGELSAVQQAFCEGFTQVTDRQPAACVTDTVTRIPDLRRRTEYMDVNQSKLVMGFRAGCAEPDTGVTATRLMCTLLGGTASSLLFRNVREKLSLCYYCSSQYDRIKGILMVQSGVDEKNADCAQSEILRQVDMIRNGEFTDEDLEAARRAVMQGLESVNDSQSAKAAYYLVQTMAVQPSDPENTRAAIGAVTRDEVIDAARRVTYECVYLLAQKGGTDNG